MSNPTTHPVSHGEWIPCSERLPEHGIKVLAFFRNELGKGRTILANHTEKFKERAEDTFWDDVPDEGFFDRDAEGVEWVPEGWFECTHTHDDTRYIDENITHWMPIPDAPADEHTAESPK